MRTYHIAVLPGDGVGPEVIGEAVKVLRAVERRIEAIRFELAWYPAGAGEYLRSGEALPAATLQAVRRADATLLGAMGLPEVRLPGGTEVTPQIDLREELDLYCGLRPVRLFHPQDSPLKSPGRIDFALVRESTEGLFSARRKPPEPGAHEALDILRVTRRGSERLFRAAFELARRRRRKLTLVDKANVLPSMAYFRAVFDTVAQEFPDVATERIYVDAAAMYLIQRPESFDVLVTENMFGDVLSDLAAALVGGMGMAPSADLGDRHAVFQPAHGSAPDIAGRGWANPTAAILSAAMMLEWLGSEETKRAAEMIQRAVEQVYQDPTARTRELGGELSTTEMGDRIVGALEA